MGNESKFNTRVHSSSVSSVGSLDDSAMSKITNDLSWEDPKLGKIVIEDVDLESQLIRSAGGKSHVCCFIVKLIFLLSVVFGSAVLIFYGLEY